MSALNNKLADFLEHLDIDSTSEDRARREPLISDLLPDEKENLSKVYDSRLAKRLFTFVRPYRAKLILSIIMMIISSLASAFQPYLIGKAFDNGIDAGNMQQLRFWTILFALAALTRWFTHRKNLLTMADVSARIVADIRSALFRHLHTLTLTFYNQYSVGSLMSRLIGDVGVLRDFLTWSITGIVYAIFSLISILVLMLYTSWQLTLVVLCVVPLISLLANYWRKHARAAYVRTRSILSHINGYLNESIAGIRVTKSFTREERNGQHFDDLNRSHFESMMMAEFLTSIFYPSIEFFSYLTTALVVGVGGWLIFNASPESIAANDALTEGVLISFVLWSTRFFDPIRELARRLTTFQATMAVSERIFRLLDTQPTIQDIPDAHQLQEVEGRVTFDDVRFSYKDDEPVLRGITLSAEPGERIAFVGETGAGKSTIIRLLARFFDIDSGTIAIDGYDIQQVTRASLRQSLGVVLQDTFLFSGSVLDNIRYGRLEATDEEVYDAARAVGAHDFILQMAQGYQTDVGENGVSLSVGQRQIISFARALLADPAILVLDEATSSVDTATEKVIETALDRLMRGRTSFVIAHRLSTIVNSDKIIVLDEGRIVEMGSHEQLLAARGRYYDLYTMAWTQQADSTKRA